MKMLFSRKYQIVRMELQMPHNYTLTSLIQTNNGFWKNRAILSPNWPFTWPTPFCLMSLIYLLHNDMGPLLPNQCYLYTFLDETDVVLVQESCRFTAASSHSVMLCTCAEETCESRYDCFPAPSPKGRRVGSCSNRSIWHVLFRGLDERNAMMKNV